MSNSVKTSVSAYSNAAFCVALFFLAISTVFAETPPVLSLGLSSYMGGTQFDHARDVAFDAAGNMIVVGGTEAPGLAFTNSITNPGSPEANSSQVDVFVAKFDASGHRLWTTIVGGPNYDRAYAVEVDAQGFIYVAGRAGAGFPVTGGAFQKTFMGGVQGVHYGNQDAFIFKMRPDGYALEWATYFGGTDGSMIRDLAVDANGDVFVSSQHTLGSSYPSAIQQVFNRGPYPQPAGKQDLVVAKVKGDGSQLLWAMHLGGTADEAGESSIRVDPSGNPVVLTATKSTNAQTTTGAYDRTLGGPEDFYLAKIRADGSGLIFATYLGGSKAESVETHHLAIDSQGNIIVAAGTLSTDFPIVGGYDNSYNGSGGSGTGASTNYSGDAVIAKLSANGSQLLASTYLGGRYGDQAEGVWLDAQGNVYVSGGTFSDNFPMAGGPSQSSLRGKSDGFIAKLSPNLGSLLYRTYIGGSEADSLRALTASPQGTVYAVGETNSNNFPLLNAYQTNYLGNTDGVIAKFTSAPSGYSISGRITKSNAGISGVTVQLSGGKDASAVTDAEGNFSFSNLEAGADYTLTPTRSGYSFAPPSQTCSHLSGDETMGFVGSAVLHEISGKIALGGNGLAGVTVALSGAQSASTETDGGGNYSFPGLAQGGDYAITPSHANYSFAPSSLALNNLSGNQTADFTAAAMYSVSGRITLGDSGLAGVTVAVSGAHSASAVTDSNGDYSFQELAGGGDYVLTPSHAGYSFTPSSVTFDNLGQSKTANFTATGIVYAISGRVTQEGNALGGVTVALSGSHTATAQTDGNGNYGFENLPQGGGYTLTPSYRQYSFAPPSRTFANLVTDQTADFATATCSFSLNPAQADVAAAGAAGSVEVVTQLGCPWSAASNAVWVAITSGSSGSGGGIVQYAVEANTSQTSRQATVIIAGQAFVVSQSAATACAYSISPAQVDVGAAAAAGSVQVTAQPGCAWTAPSNAAWIASNSTGSGNGAAQYSVAPNTSAASRQGTVTIGGQAFLVRQAAAAAPPPGLFSETFSTAGGLPPNWTKVDEGTTDKPSNWSVSGGALHQTSNIYGGSPSALPLPGTYVLAGRNDWSDYTVSLRMQSTDNDAIGLMFGYKDAKNYYRFAIDNQRNYRRLVKVVDGVWTKLAEDSFAYTRGQWYAVEATMAAGQVKIRFNGQPLFSVNDASLQSGKIALYAWCNTGSDFDDVVVTGVSGVTEQVAVTVNPPTATLNAAQSQTFTASVTGTANTAVTWSRSPALGSIAASGNYTAPSAVASQTTVKVRAASVADPTRFSEATVTLLPSGGGSAMNFADNFTSNSMANWTSADEGTIDAPSSWSVSGGVLHQTSNIYGGSPSALPLPGTYVLAGDEDWSNYKVGARMKSTDNDAIGLMFGYRDPNNYYRFSMDQSRNYRRLAKVVNGLWTQLAQDTMSYAKGQWYAVEATIADGQIQIVFDGQPLFSVNDSSLQSGKIALYSWCNTGSDFDDVVVTGVSGVTERVAVTVDPQSVALGAAENQAFTATVTGAANTAVTWSLNPALGSIAPDGRYTAPGFIVTQTTVKVRAASVADPTKFSEATVTLLTSGGAPPVGFSDDFNSGSMANWTKVDEGITDAPSSWSVTGGVLHQAGNIYGGNPSGLPLPGTYVVAGDGDWSDYTVRVRMRSTDNDAIGLMFGYQDPDNYYRFSMDQSRTYRRLVKVVDGVWTQLAQDAFTYVKGQWYTVEARMADGKIQILFNGQPLFNVDDSSLQSGKIALYSWCNAGTDFDDVVVTPEP